MATEEMHPLRTTGRQLRFAMDIDHFSYLIDRQHRFLLIGIVFLLITAVFTLSEETLERYHGLVYRAKEPKRFWWDVVLYFLAGLWFIGLYLYQNSN